MDKLIHDDRGNVTISNDGATIMRLLEVVHPAASLLVDVARSQDAEAGDGTTTVVLLAGELLRAVKPFVEDGAPPRAVARALRAAGALPCARLRELAVPIGGKQEKDGKRNARCCQVRLDLSEFETRLRGEGLFRGDGGRRRLDAGPEDAGPVDARGEEGGGR